MFRSFFYKAFAFFRIITVHLIIISHLWYVKEEKYLSSPAKCSIMKVNRSSRSNLRFLYGSVFFFAVLIFTMVLFVYYAMGEASRNVESKMFVYNIHVTGDGSGAGCDVLLDDSLVFSSPALYADTLLRVNRYYENDTVVENGKQIIREITYFSSESMLRVIGGVSGDTLSKRVGNNSNIEISINGDRVEAVLTE